VIPRRPDYLLARANALALRAAERIDAEPERAVRIVQANLTRWLHTMDSRSRPLMEPWIAIAHDAQAMAALLRESGPRADHLRSVAPLAGVLTQNERLEALRAFDVQWAADHDNTPEQGL